MKYYDDNFFELRTDIFSFGLNSRELSLYVWLKRLENKYGRDNDGLFYHTDEDLALELHCNLKTLKKAKAGLKQKAPELVQMFRLPKMQDLITGKQSPERITWYKMDLDIETGKGPKNGPLQLSEKRAVE